MELVKAQWVVFKKYGILENCICEIFMSQGPSVPKIKFIL